MSMPVNINAEALELHKLMEEVKGYYIPPYQRPYTWNKENIERFIETIKTGLDHALAKNENTSFLGAILTVQDPAELEKHTEFYPTKAQEMCTH